MAGVGAPLGLLRIGLGTLGRGVGRGPLSITIWAGLLIMGVVVPGPGGMGGLRVVRLGRGLLFDRPNASLNLLLHKSTASSLRLSYRKGTLRRRRSRGLLLLA